MTIQRFISLAALSLAAALTLGACAAPSGTRECVNGTFCPLGTECSGDGTTCVTAGGCGNAVVAATEECDDGNVNGGDGCNQQCQIEKCGDGNVTSSSGEVCDDGNNVNGDGCSADCESNETCGNGTVDTAKGEVCDDGNIKDADGCAANCKSDESCNNGIVDMTVGEKCDDGMAVGGPCSPDCMGGTGCGNGEVVSPEECDDSGTNDADDCVVGTSMAYACKLARCGDGITAVDATGPRKEQCDGGKPDHTSPGPVETADCNIDCTLSVCGDGKVNGHDLEQCDDNNTVSGDGCDSNCKPTGCGNGVVTGTEVCDDGNANNGDSCDNNCKPTGCGNGVVTGTEVCDDGNANNGDGCDNNCTVTACGNGIPTTGEACDDGNPTNGDG
ncbi:MAG TPA: DUF4215 domain-containing protein, partial [Kofleriaceae bacterium]|nr:DUF4215 domain-containing protein [Kofleriaceae bacterium]